MDRLTGKTALIVGADGITAGIAARFRQEGAKVSTVDTHGRDASAIADAVRAAIGDGPLDILALGGGDVPDEHAWAGVDAWDGRQVAASLGQEAANTLAAVRAAGDALKRQGGSIIFLFNPAGLYSEGGASTRSASTR
jgi:NAD(P)-dependent dehydrogenase (short-subunit alcohol dehydrogenase family)